MKNFILYSDEYADESNAHYLDELIDELRSLTDKPVSRTIICFGDLGLWSGRQYAIKTFSGKYGYSQLFYSSCEYSTWFIDKNFDLRYVGSHHDGDNYYLYRAIKNNLSERQLENLFRIASRKKLTRSQLNCYTQPIGNEIMKMIGGLDYE